MAVTAGRVPPTVASPAGSPELDSRLQSSVYQYTPSSYLQLLTLGVRSGHMIQCEIKVTKVLPGEDKTPSSGLILSNHDILVPCHS